MSSAELPPDRRRQGSGESTEALRAKADGGSHLLPIEHTLDLHPFQPRDIPSVVEEYVRAAHEAGLGEVRLIHGRGTGVQRGIVQSVLEKSGYVTSFHDSPESHLGATVAVISRLKAGTT
jgi:DNA-nicking Smr family endonuclease